MSKTNINWADSVGNPTVGCTKILKGCANCYAVKMAYRLQCMGIEGYEGVVCKTPSGKLNWTGRINFIIDRFIKVAKCKKPKRIFVDSMSDLYHENIPMEEIVKIYQVMIDYPQHTYLSLTKRIERANRLHPQILTKLFGNDLVTNLPNFWLGYSASTQQEIFDMQDYSKNTVVNWISIEPMIQEIRDIDTDWAVIGCESGDKKRAFENKWVNTLIERHPHIPFWVKQIRDEKNNLIEDVNLFPKEYQLRQLPEIKNG